MAEQAVDLTHIGLPTPQIGPPSQARFALPELRRSR